MVLENIYQPTVCRLCGKRKNKFHSHSLKKVHIVLIIFIVLWLSWILPWNLIVGFTGLIHSTATGLTFWACRIEGIFSNCKITNSCYCWFMLLL